MDMFSYQIGKNSVPEPPSLNIAYSQTAPTDTTKLWVKTSEPSSVQVKSSQAIIESIETLTETTHNNICSAKCAKVNGTIYVFGLDGTNNIYTFNPQNNTFTTLNYSLISIDEWGMTCGVKGDCIYYGADNNGGYAIYEINTSLQQVSLWASGSVSSNKGLVVCGIIDNNMYLVSNNENDTNIYKIDMQTKTLSSVSTIPISGGIYFAEAICVVGSKIYFFGGRTASCSWTNKIFCFDSSNNSCVEKTAVLPNQMAFSCAIRSYESIYIFGGMRLDSGNRLFNNICKYDVSSDTITNLTTTLPTAKGYINGINTGGSIYLFGGSVTASWAGRTDGTNTIYKFDFSFSLENGKIQINEKIGNNVFNILPNVEIGVSAVYKGNESNQAEVVEAYLYDEDEEEWVLI